MAGPNPDPQPTTGAGFALTRSRSPPHGPTACPLTVRPNVLIPASAGRHRHQAFAITDPDAIHHFPRYHDHQGRSRRRRLKQHHRLRTAEQGSRPRHERTCQRSRRASASTAHPQPALGEVNVVHARSAARAPHCPLQRSDRGWPPTEPMPHSWPIRSATLTRALRRAVPFDQPVSREGDPLAAPISDFGSRESWVRERWRALPRSVRDLTR